MIRRAAGFLLLAALAAACSGSAESPRPSTHPLLRELRRMEFLGRSGAADRPELLARRHVAYVDGWRHAWKRGWRDALTSARQEAPGRLHREALAAIGLAGPIALAVGLLLGLATGRSRRRDPDEPDPLFDAARPQGELGWGELLRAIASRWLRRTAEALEPGDGGGAPVEAHHHALHATREAERRLRAALAELDRIVERHGESAPAERLRRGLVEWRDEERDLRSRLREREEQPRPPGAELLDTLRARAERADELRVALNRADLAGDAVDATTWERWLTRADERPQPARRVLRAPPPSAAVLRWGRLAALGLPLALMLAAGWAAAGAVPTPLVLLVGAALLGVMLAARARLARQRRTGLLPGRADRLARGLGWTLAYTLAGIALSASASAESGLDLGEPTPIHLPASPEPDDPPPARLPAPGDEAADDA